MKKHKNLLIKTCLMLTLAFTIIYLINNKRYYLSLDYCPINSKQRSSTLHSQFYEDTILSTVFANISNGFYIDVGANDPDHFSVTKHFYLKGWTGVNIEPIEKWYLQFLDKRPKDINLNIGVSNVEDTLEFYRIFSDMDKTEDTLSTFNKEVLESSIKQGFTSYETFKVPVITLNKIIEENNIQDIDFLKIDVEGTEREVLMGIDLKKYRPKVFVIEATEPNGPIPNDYLWKDLMIDNNYVFVLNDGLNHYYLAREHYKKLIPKFIDAFHCAVKSNYKYRIINHPMLFSYPVNPNF